MGEATYRSGFVLRRRNPVTSRGPAATLRVEEHRELAI